MVIPTVEMRNKRGKRNQTGGGGSGESPNPGLFLLVLLASPSKKTIYITCQENYRACRLDFPALEHSDKIDGHLRRVLLKNAIKLPYLGLKYLSPSLPLSDFSAPGRKEEDA